MEFLKLGNCRLWLCASPRNYHFFIVLRNKGLRRAQYRSCDLTDMLYADGNSYAYEGISALGVNLRRPLGNVGYYVKT